MHCFEMFFSPVIRPLFISPCKIPREVVYKPYAYNRKFMVCIVRNVSEVGASMGASMLV